MLITIEPFYKLLLISFSENPAYFPDPLPIAHRVNNPRFRKRADNGCYVKPGAGQRQPGAPSMAMRSSRVPPPAHAVRLCLKLH